MNPFTDMTPVQAAALEIGLLCVLMLALKLYVGGQRRQHKTAAGDLSNPDFNRATRVQLNAVEDVPVLMAGLLGLAALGLPGWYIHACGLGLLVSRILHAWGLAGSGGFSIGRFIGTLGTYLVYLAVAGALIFHAVQPLF